LCISVLTEHAVLAINAKDKFLGIMLIIFVLKIVLTRINPVKQMMDVVMVWKLFN